MSAMGTTCAKPVPAPSKETKIRRPAVVANVRIFDPRWLKFPTNHLRSLAPDFEADSGRKAVAKTLFRPVRSGSKGANARGMPSCQKSDDWSKCLLKKQFGWLGGKIGRKEGGLTRQLLARGQLEGEPFVDFDQKNAGGVNRG
jgi:hypothetical protein